VDIASKTTPTNELFRDNDDSTPLPLILPDLPSEQPSMAEMSVLESTRVGAKGLLLKGNVIKFACGAFGGREGMLARHGDEASFAVEEIGRSSWMVRRRHLHPWHIHP